jgi:hypothetical protein
VNKFLGALTVISFLTALMVFQLAVVTAVVYGIITVLGVVFR